MNIIEQYSEGLAAIASLVTAVVTAYTIRVSFAFDPTGSPKLESHIAKRASIVVGIVTMAASLYFSKRVTDGTTLMTVMFASTACVVGFLSIYLVSRALGLQRLPLPDGRKADFIGGIWLSETAKKRLRDGTAASVQALLRNDPRNLDSVWPRGSRVALYGVITASALMVTVSSTIAVCTAIAVASIPDAPELARRVSRIANEWGNFAPRTEREIPSEFAALAESVLAEWSMSSPKIPQHVPSQQAQRAALAIANYLDAKKELDRLRTWLTAVSLYHRQVSKDRNLALQTERMLLSRITDRLRVTPAPDARFSQLIEDGFSLANDIVAESPSLKNDPDMIRHYIILHHKRAQDYARSNKGIWDPAEIDAAYALVQKLMTLGVPLELKHIDLILNVQMRKLNYDCDDREKRQSSLDQAAVLLKWSSHYFDRAMSNISMQSFSVAVNHAKLNEERILFTVYGEYPVTEVFVDAPDLRQQDLNALASDLEATTISALRQVKAFLRSQNEWHHWANVTLDIARAKALLAEIARMQGHRTAAARAADEAADELVAINSSSEVPPALKKRLMTDIVNRPEFATVRKLERVAHLTTYYSIEGR